MKKLMMICITAAVLMEPLAAYAHPVRVFVGPRFGWGYSSYWGWGPYGYPYGGYGYGYRPATGTLKFDTKVKDAEVYINGAYAGTVGELKTMHLRPGTYDVEVRSPGRTQFAEKVYVASGKTLKLNPDLRIEERTQGQP